MSDPYIRRATVVRWVDGDTVDVVVDCGFSIYSRQRLRVAGIDTPERGQDGYSEATDYAESLAPADSEVTVITSKTGKFGRYLAQIVVPDGRDLAVAMLAENHAKEYSGGKR